MLQEMGCFFGASVAICWDGWNLGHAACSCSVEERHLFEGVAVQSSDFQWV